MELCRAAQWTLQESPASSELILRVSRDLSMSASTPVVPTLRHEIVYLLLKIISGILQTNEQFCDYSCDALPSILL
jgi:hypothetical protein